MGHSVLERHECGQQERKLHGEDAGAAGQIFPPGAIATVSGITTRRGQLGLPVGDGQVLDVDEGHRSSPAAPRLTINQVAAWPRVADLRHPQGTSRARNARGLALV
jgi:hypothetical protein